MKIEYLLAFALVGLAWAAWMAYDLNKEEKEIMNNDDDQSDNYFI